MALPRLRGDERYAKDCNVDGEASPRARGDERIAVGYQHVSISFPRACGDKRWPARVLNASRRFPPAHAGMEGQRQASLPAWPCFPRGCGD